MRVALTIDDDVVEAARSRAAREKRSIGAVVSEMLRIELSAQDPRSAKQNGFVPIPSRGGVVTSELVHELLDADD